MEQAQKILTSQPLRLPDNKVQEWLASQARQAKKDFKEPEIAIVHLASIYEELDGQAGWQDFLFKVEDMKKQLTKQLLEGKLGSDRPAGVTDNDLRSMLWVLNRVTSIPFEARFRYERWRAMQDALAASSRKLQV